MLASAVVLVMTLCVSAFAGLKSGSWSLNPADFRYDMSLYFSLADRSLEDLDTYEIGAFVDDECRGVAEKLELTGGETCLYMRIRSNSAQGAQIEFRMRQKGSDEYVVLRPEDGADFIFKSNDRVGMPSAPFVLARYFNIEVTSEGNGTIDFENGLYKEGAQISVKAIADEGYRFSEWSDGLTEADRVITVSGDLSLSASFVRDIYKVVFKIDGEEFKTLDPMPAYKGNIPSFVDAAIDEPRKRVYLSKQGEIVAYNFDGSEDKTYSIDQIHNPSLFLYPDGDLAVISICFVNLSDTVAVAHFNPDMTINGVDDITVCHYPPLQDTGSSMMSLYNVTDTKSVASKMLFSLILTTDTTYYYDNVKNRIFPHIVLNNPNRNEKAIQYAGELPSGYVGGSKSIEKEETYWLDKESGEVKNVTFHNDFIGEKMHPYYLFDDNYQQVFNLRHHRDYFRNILNGNPLTDAQRQRIESILDTPDDCLVILRGKMTQNNQ